MNKRELELERAKAISNLVELSLLIDTKLDMILEKLDEKQDSKGSKKTSKVQNK